MHGGNNSVKEADPTSISYSQASAWVGGKEENGNDQTNTARNWLDGIYGKKDGNSYSWKDGEVKIKYPVFTGTTYSMNYINHNDAFLVAKEISKSGNPYGLPVSADSHLMKDSEWGAVSYLAQSKYGLENNEICINNITLNSGSAARTKDDGKTGIESVYAVTGLTSKKTVDKEGEKPENENNVGENAQEVVEQINSVTENIPTSIGEIYTWKQMSGQKASSSGTIYGIYDLSGGVWERTASYTANNHDNLTSFGKSLLYNGSKTDETSTKYTTVYAHSSEDKTGTAGNTASQKNYDMEANKRKFGNAIAETSTTGNGNTSWFDNVSWFVGLSSPFSVRGGIWWEKASAGLFCYSRENGNSYYYLGFRVALVAF